MEKLVSVIIPVYNVEKYIDECFQSLIGQIHQNFEAILIDDGSTDNSGIICDKYAEMDNRFSVYHTENNGIGAARNLGLEKARGEFCFFLDPDDVIEADSLSYLVNLIEDKSADIALAVTRQFAGEYKPVGEENVVETVYNGYRDICEKVLFDKSDLKPLDRKQEPSRVTYEFFSSLYRMSLLNEKNIRFLPISYGEDTYVCFKYLLNSNIAVTSTKKVYSHRRNPTSTTFQYHPLYLEETKKYYSFYLELFEKYATEYLHMAKEGLDGQYFRRCISAIERELFMSPKEYSAKQKVKTIRHIKSDKKFREMFTYKNIKFVNGKMRLIVCMIKIGVYAPLIKYLSRKK